MMKKLKIGILGAGFVQNFHMQSYKEIPNADIVAVGAYEKEEVDVFSKKWNIPNSVFGEDAIEKLCSMKEIDAVCIGIPNEFHARAAKAAAENGKHVICEKPLGRTAEEAKEMLDAVTKAGVIHCYAENQLFFPMYDYAFKAIENGAVGDVYWVRSREAHGGPHSLHFWKFGVGLDMGCHSVEVARRAFGNDTPVEVMMWGETITHGDKTDAEDNCVILVKYKHGQLGQAENSWSTRAGLDLRTEIYGKKGDIFMDNTRETGIKIFSTAGLGYVVEKAESDKGWMFPVPNEHVVYGYYDELKHFVNCMIEGKEPTETFKDGVIVNAILDAGFKSMKEKKWIPVDL
ncbi:MAG: Gfo/Idh/MocA family protein [Candidatus Hodarchaeota archaeon]